MKTLISVETRSVIINVTTVLIATAAPVENSSSCLSVLSTAAKYIWQ